MSGPTWNERANDLAAEAIDGGEPAAWFDRLYAEGAAGGIAMPWERDAGRPTLVDWLDTWLDGRTGEGLRAAVVGCGLGADAEHVASRGLATTGFDISEHAIAEARRRHTGGPVDYRVADLLDLDDDLVGAFDLVVEIWTLQALPDPPRRAAAAGIASLLAPGGHLFVLTLRDVGGPPDPLPPYPLTRADLAMLEVGGVGLVDLTEVHEEGSSPSWRAVLRRDPRP